MSGRRRRGNLQLPHVASSTGSPQESAAAAHSAFIMSAQGMCADQTCFNHVQPHVFCYRCYRSVMGLPKQRTCCYIYISFGPLMFKILFSNQCLVACMYDTAASRQVWQAWSHPSFRPSTLTGGVLQAWENGEFVIYIYL